MSIYNQLGAMRNDGVLGDGEGNVLPLTRYSKDELIGITFYYGIRLGNPNNKSKKQLIKTIQANREYQRRVRKEENNPRVNPVLRRTANKIIKELRKEAEEERRLVDPDPRDLELLDIEEQEKETDISYTIMERANQTSNTDADWYAKELSSELSLAGREMGVNELRPGDFVFFGYNARYAERYPYYDRRPLAFILDMKGDKMLGCNVHYLNPDIRDSFAQTMINKTAIQVPGPFKKTLHSYFYSNISGIVYSIPENEYGDIARLVTENFVDPDGMSVDINAVWDSVN